MKTKRESEQKYVRDRERYRHLDHCGRRGRTNRARCFRHWLSIVSIFRSSRVTKTTWHLSIRMNRSHRQTAADDSIKRSPVFLRPGEFRRAPGIRRQSLDNSDTHCHYDSSNDDIALLSILFQSLPRFPCNQQIIDPLRQKGMPVLLVLPNFDTKSWCNYSSV